MIDTEAADTVVELNDLMRQRPPGWDLKAQALVVRALYGDVETMVHSAIPIIARRVHK